MDTSKCLLSSVHPNAGYGATFTFTEECIGCWCTKQRHWTVALKAEFWKLKRSQRKAAGTRSCHLLCMYVCHTDFEHLAVGSG
jgi:hypothetical protein